MGNSMGSLARSTTGTQAGPKGASGDKGEPGRTGDRGEKVSQRAGQMCVCVLSMCVHYVPGSVCVCAHIVVSNNNFCSIDYSIDFEPIRRSGRSKKAAQQ